MNLKIDTHVKPNYQLPNSIFAALNEIVSNQENQ